MAEKLEKYPQGQQNLNLQLEKYVKKDFFPISVTHLTWKNNKHFSEIPTHAHNFSEIVLVSSGSLRHHIGEESEILRAGDFCLIHPGTEHSYSALSPKSEFYNIVYDSSVPVPMIMLTQSPFLHSLYPPPAQKVIQLPGALGKVAGKDLAEITALLQKIMSESRRKRPGYQTFVISMFTGAVILLSYYCREENLPPRSWALGNAIGLLEKHWSDSTFSLKQVAEDSGMNMRTMQRQFKSVFGISPVEYLQILRLNRAISMLQKTSMDKTDIAHKCGFCDYTYMWRLFRRYLLCSPIDIRKGVVAESHLKSFAARLKQHNTPRR